MNSKKSLRGNLMQLLWAVLMGVGLSLFHSVSLGLFAAGAYLVYFWLVSPLMQKARTRQTARAYAVIIGRMPHATDEQRDAAVRKYLRRRQTRQTLTMFLLGLLLFLPLPMALTAWTPLAGLVWGEKLIQGLNILGTALMVFSVFGFAGTRHNPLTPAEEIPEPRKNRP